MTPDPSPSPTRLMIPSPGPTTWDIIAQWVAIGVLITGTLTFIFFAIDNLFSSEKKRKFKQFYLWIAAIALFGGLLSFFLPIAINSGFRKDDDGRDLRQLILYTTGGVLGVITLGETHRKNNQEKEKNENDHIRQVHAERRSRYATAIEQLASTEGTIRLGGVYTLAGLVDEWLADSYIKEEKEREHESQVIINNLCAYIRSPFPLAEKRVTLNSQSPKDDSYVGNISADKSSLREEQEIRRAIFTEISMRVPDSSENAKTNHKDWRQFNFNFRESPVFYPLDGINFPEADFSGSAFYGDSNFSGSSFQGDTKFHKVGFKGKALFVNTKFHGDAIFTDAFFEDISTFTKSIFVGKVQFTGAFFVKDPNFVTIVEGEMSPAKFSSQINYKREDFETHPQSPRNIDTAPPSRNNGAIIPKGCVFLSPNNSSTPITEKITSLHKE